MPCQVSFGTLQSCNDEKMLKYYRITAEYCKKLYMDVTNSNYGKITWSHIKPIIQGKILYGPDNNQTREIIKIVSFFVFFV